MPTMVDRMGEQGKSIAHMPADGWGVITNDPRWPLAPEDLILAANFEAYEEARDIGFLAISGYEDPPRRGR